MTSATSFIVGGVTGVVQNLDTTSGLVFDTYLANIDIVKQAVTQLSTLTDDQITSLKNALDILNDIFKNGKLDPSTGRVSYLTQDLANPLASIFTTLTIAGVDPTGTPLQYPAPADFAAIRSALTLWKNTVSTTGVLNTLFNFAVTAKNRSMQSLVELDYVSTGNDIMATQMSSLETALGITKSVLATLGDLQSIHNQVDIAAKGSFGSSFDMTGAGQSEDQFIQNYQHAASSFFGTPITPTTSFKPNEPGFELANIVGTVDPLISSLQPLIDTFDDYIMNGPNLISTTLIANGISPNTGYNSGDIWKVNGSNTVGGIGINGSGTAMVAQFKSDIFGNNGWNNMGNPALPESQQTRFIPVPYFDDTNPFIARHIGTGPGQLIQGYMRFPSINGGATEIPVYIVRGLPADAPAVSTSYRIEMSTLRALTVLPKVQISANYFAYNTVQSDALIYGQYDSSVDGANTFALPIHPYSQFMDLHGYAIQHLSAPGGFTTNQVWLKLDPNARRPTNSWTVDSRDPAIALNVRNTLVQAIANLNSNIASLTAANASSDQSSLLTRLRQVRDDLTATLTINGNLITTSTPLQDCVAPIQNWLIDRYNLRNTPDSVKAGLYQQNITSAITAGESLNTSQQEKVRNFLYIFQEYYKSASAVLQQLTQIIQRMGQGINR